MTSWSLVLIQKLMFLNQKTFFTQMSHQEFLGLVMSNGIAILRHTRV